MQDKVQINPSAKENIIQWPNGTSVLQLKAAMESPGDYTCYYENRMGKDTKLFEITVFTDDNSIEMTAIFVFLTVIAILLVITARLLYVRFSVWH